MGILSTESIVGPSAQREEQAARCASCGTPLAADQRYCLECGERRATVSEFLRSGPPPSSSPPAAPPLASPPGPAAHAPRGNAVSLLAGIGVLLLAMGVGVLIGRSGSSSAKAPAPQVIQVGSGTGSSSTDAAEAPFTGDWPAGKNGYTIELQRLPEASTAAAVEAAKAAAQGKGAKSVGALNSRQFPSVGGAGLVIYSGEYTKRSEAQKAIGALRRSFPAAKVVEVSPRASSGKATAATPGGGTRTPTTAPPTAQSFKHVPRAPVERGSGKKAVEESAKLPDVVETP